MTIKLVSVNCGQPASLQQGRYRVVSGIGKTAQSGLVRIAAGGVAGDAVCDTEHHGGADQAVYVYRDEDYEWWEAELGKALTRGCFGDNLTVSGLPADLSAGDRLRIGAVLLEVTAPRIPCATLAAQMGEKGFALRFRRAERPGWYCRVVEAGELQAGDSVSLHAAASPGISMRALFRLYYRARPTPAELEAALAAPIAERLQARFRRKLDSA